MDIDVLPTKIHGHQGASADFGHVGTRTLLGTDFLRRLSTSTSINVQARFDAGFTDSDTQEALEERGIELQGRLRS